MPLPTDDKTAAPEAPKVVSLDPQTTALLSNTYTALQDLGVRVEAMGTQFATLATTVMDNGRRIGRLEKEIFPTGAPPALPPLPPVDGATILSIPPMPGPPSLQKRTTSAEDGISRLERRVDAFEKKVETHLDAQSKVMGVAAPTGDKDAKEARRAFYRSRDFKKIVISLTVLAGTLYQIADRFVHPPPAPVVLPAPAASR